jgi:hypothetical protein
MTNDTQESGSDHEHHDNLPLHPILLLNKGSTYNTTLYDVDGFVLMNENGEKLNVFTLAMKDEMESGRIRAIRSLKDGGYVYFITHPYQLERFRSERDYGSIRYQVKYYVYRDIN